MKALVTGASGLIGAHIVRELVDRGDDVRCLVRPTSRRDLLDGLPVTCVVADLPDTVGLDAICADRDVVFHTAVQFAYTGVSRAALHRTAVEGTEAVLRACASQRVSTVVLTSSSVVFGHSDSGTVVREMPAFVSGDGEPAYVAAKIAQHRHALRLAAPLRLDVRFACPTMTLGPTTGRLGPSNGVIVAYLSDPFASTYPGGCNLVSARDVAAGHLLVADHGAAGESYLLGSDNLTWRQVHETIADLAGTAPPRVELNHVSAFLAATLEEVLAATAGRAALSSREQASMIGRYYWYSHAKAASLGYAPRHARNALIEAISWLVASPHVAREVRARLRLSAEIYRFRALEAVH